MVATLAQAAPRVSALLLAYNRGDRLPATLDSVLAQGFSDFELIISDDASTDRTPEVGADYERRDGRVRYRLTKAGQELTPIRANGFSLRFVTSDRSCGQVVRQVSQYSLQK